MTTMSKPKPVRQDSHPLQKKIKWEIRVGAAWSRLLWGVDLISPRSKPMLLGSVWLDPMPKSQYTGEPSRALLFTTRKAAREWCQGRMAARANRTDQCQDWRFRPVRVREIVRREP